VNRRSTNRIRARQRNREVDTSLGSQSDVLAQQLFFPPPEKRDTEKVDAARHAIVAELARFETDIVGPFALGESVCAVDFAVYPLLAMHRRYELRQDSLGLVAAWGPKVLELTKGVESLDYFDKTYPPHWRS
jgi:glutathione S-transferase